MESGFKSLVEPEIKFHVQRMHIQGGRGWCVGLKARDTSYADTHWLEGNPQHYICDDEDTVSKLSLS